MTALRSRATAMVLATVVAAALLVAGCGGGNDQYKKQVTQAAQQFQTEARAAGTNLSASESPEQFKTAATRFKAAVTKFTDRLSSLKPPKGAKDEQDKLVAALEHFGGTVDEISRRVTNVDASNADRLVALIPQLQSDVQKVTSDAQDLEDAVNDA